MIIPEDNSKIKVIYKDDKKIKMLKFDHYGRQRKEKSLIDKNNIYFINKKN